MAALVSAASAPAWGRPVAAIELTYAGDAFNQNLLLYLPEETCGPYPVLVYIHGGGWLVGDASDVDPYVNELTARGFAVASLNYRYSFQATFPAQVNDCKGAVRYLRANAATYNLDPDHVGVFGESAGGYLSNMLGLTNDDPAVEGDVGGNLGFSSRVQAFVDGYGHTDLIALANEQNNPNSESSRMIGLSIPEIIANWSDPAYADWVALLLLANPIEHVDASDPEAYLVHGTADPLLPVTQAEILDAALTTAGVPHTLRLMPGVGHELPIAEQPPIWSFLQRMLIDSRTVHVKFGAAEGDRFGTSVAIIGDVNGDGVADFAVGTPFDDSTGTDAGSVSIYSGKTAVSLKKLKGAAAGDRFGSSIAAAGDVNGDGKPDLIVGAPRANGVGSDSGKAYVYSSATWAKLFTLSGETAGDRFGTAVAGPGDVNGDGRADILVGAPYNDIKGTSSGRAYVYSGLNGAVLKKINGSAAGDKLGSAVAGAGDVNNDGRADIIVGAPFSDVGGADSGKAFVLTCNGSTWLVRFSLPGAAAGDQFGSSVAGAGDVNNDGYDDLVVGSPGSDEGAIDSGKAIVISGFDGALLATLLPSAAQAGQQFGSAVASAGDVDGDGNADVLVAAVGHDGCGPETGQIALFTVGATALDSTFDGRQFNGRFGKSLAAGIDLTGDGVPEMVVGSDGRRKAGVASGAVDVLSLIGTP